MQQYRLWEGDEDRGAAPEKAARVWLKFTRESYPDKIVRLEPLEDSRPPALLRSTLFEFAALK